MKKKSLVLLLTAAATAVFSGCSGMAVSGGGDITSVNSPGPAHSIASANAMPSQ